MAHSIPLSCQGTSKNTSHQYVLLKQTWARSPQPISALICALARLQWTAGSRSSRTLGPTRPCTRPLEIVPLKGSRETSPSRRRSETTRPSQTSLPTYLSLLTALREPKHTTISGTVMSTWKILRLHSWARIPTIRERSLRLAMALRNSLESLRASLAAMESATPASSSTSTNWKWVLLSLTASLVSIKSWRVSLCQLVFCW